MIEILMIFRAQAYNLTDTLLYIGFETSLRNTLNKFDIFTL